jgi:hypothetical protein
MFISNGRTASLPRFSFEGSSIEIGFRRSKQLLAAQFGAGAISRLDGNIWNVFCAHAKVGAWLI